MTQPTIMSLADATHALPGVWVQHLRHETYENRPGPYFIYGPPPDGAIEYFYQQQFTPTVSLYTARNIQVDGPWFDVGALLSRDDVLLSCREIALDPTTASARERLNQPRRTLRHVSGQAILLATNGHQIFGHWLIDFLPKIYVCHKMGVDFAQVKILLPQNMADFGEQFLQILGFTPENIVKYNPDHEILAVEELLIPTVLRWGGRLPDIFQDAVAYLDDLINRNNPPARDYLPERIFLKRRQDSPNKTLLNRQMVEHLAVKSGLHVFQPEKYSVLEQIHAFRKARYVFSEYGSIVHSTMFSRPGVVVGCIHQPPPHSFDALQSGIAERLHQITGYVFAQGEPGQVSVDEAAVAACLYDFFRA